MYLSPSPDEQRAIFLKVGLSKQADREAGMYGHLVEGVNQQRVVLLGDDDAWSITQRDAVLCKLALDAVDGQAWQPQAEDTPPVR